MIENIMNILKGKRFPLQDEKVLQAHIEYALRMSIALPDIQRERILDAHSTIDFFLYDSIGMEIKIKGQKRSIYKQCERYCGFEEIKQLILVTGMSMGFPAQLNGKDVYVFNLSTAWL